MKQYSHDSWAPGETIQFLGKTIGYSHAVLTPRIETESLVLWVVARISGPSCVVDVGTGSWAIAIALATRYPTAKIIATDISPSAREQAETNMSLNTVDIEVIDADLWSEEVNALAVAALNGGDLLIVANLPYIPDWYPVPTDVIADDPSTALWGGPTGLEITQRLIRQVFARSFDASVSIACEVFEWHAQMLQKEFDVPWRVFETWNDLCGVERFCIITQKHANI